MLKLEMLLVLTKPGLTAQTMPPERQQDIKSVCTTGPKTRRRKWEVMGKDMEKESGVCCVGETR